MAKDREHYAHLQWLGYVQPVGLVVSIPALLDAQAQVNANVGPLQQRFVACLRRNARDELIPEIANFPAFVENVLGWQPGDLISAAELRDSLEVVLQEYNETLRPTYAVKSLRPDDPARPWLMLIQTLPSGAELDKAAVDDDRRWQASPQARLERLLRETETPIGLLVNGTHVRLVYAPRGETSGYLTFSVANMAEVAGRPILAAFEMLLGAERVFNIGLGKRQDLASILADSRKRQNVVSTELADQVLAALNELLRGFQAANDQRRGQLLADYLDHDPNQVYGGLLTVLMRLVFVLYAEDRDLLSADPVFVNHYSVAGLFERLRADDGRYPDTMDQRYGAWAQLLALFRLIFDGGSHGSLRIPGRQGYLFDPDRYPFLEGRPRGSLRTEGERLDVPRVSDGIVYRVLSNLLILDGERLSYRTLDVEQIGSVYETVMGFNLEVAGGRSIAIKAVKSGGAPTIVNLEALAEKRPAERSHWLADHTGQKFTGQMAESLKKAATIEELRDALDKKIAWRVTPGLVPKGAMVLQPSDERRRSGSHYTPRSLTEPIVRKTLEPLLKRLGAGSLGMGDRGRQDERQDRIVSRPSGLAVGHGPGSGMLRSNEDIPPGGALRHDESNSPSGGVDTGQYRGGAWPGIAEGISPVPADRSGQPAGVGNAPVAHDPSEALGRAGVLASAENSGSTGTNAAIAAKGPQEAPTPVGDGNLELGDRNLGVGDRNLGVGDRNLGVGDGEPPTPQLLIPNSCPTPEQILALKVCDPAMGSAAFLVETCRQLGDKLVEAWHFHNCVPKLPPDEDELLHARRLIAQRCLYGVDKNPMAVDLAKLSLWLATLAKDHPFTFLDHALRCGDSLVGLAREQIAAFHWQPGQPVHMRKAEIEGQIERATNYRKQILGARDDAPYQSHQSTLALAEESLDRVRRLGDLVVAAFFGGDKPAARTKLRQRYLELVDRAWGSQGRAEDVAQWLKLVGELRAGSHPVAPFHWEIEFPEVFGRENGGFDAFVGNPPFVGGKKISTILGDAYREWLAVVNDDSNSNSDLVAHFFRRAFCLLRRMGAMGLIATKTISQGETRYTGLRWICTHGGTIFNAHRRMKWPGQAAVTVSLLHISKSAYEGSCELDGQTVERISAYLFHFGGDDNPCVLKTNEDKSFIGSFVLGMGFTFDDSDGRGVASTIADMRRLIANGPRNAERIFPYICGEDVNDDPQHRPTRFVIDFFDMSLDEASRWPDLLAIVREKVKPERDKQKRDAIKLRWWQYADKRPGLRKALEHRQHALVCTLHQQHWALSFLPTNVVFSHGLAVLTLDTFSAFGTLQCRVHELWTRFFASSLEDRLRYTPSDCFKTFPFPENFETDAKLEAVGKGYYEFRAALMVKNDEGLTKTYNRFHDPNETSAEIKKLRELHAAMDRAVLDAYGWTDLQPTCEFLLDYEEEEDEEPSPRPSPKGRGRSKPWRCRWPDEFRDTVLARLLELNKQRAEQERLSGEAAEAKEKKATKRQKRKTKDEGQGLF